MLFYTATNGSIGPQEVMIPVKQFSTTHYANSLLIDLSDGVLFVRCVYDQQAIDQLLREIPE